MLCVISLLGEFTESLLRVYWESLLGITESLLGEITGRDYWVLLRVYWERLLGITESLLGEFTGRVY